MIKELQEQLSNSTITNVKLAYEAINGKGSEKNKPRRKMRITTVKFLKTRQILILIKM